MAKKLKPIIFHSSFEDQRLYSQLSSIKMSVGERLKEMYRLNRKQYGDSYGRVSKIMEIFTALPGESINDFYYRIDNIG